MDQALFLTFRRCLQPLGSFCFIEILEFGITKDLLLIEQKERDTDRQKLLQAYDELSTESRKKLLDYAEDLRNR